MFKNTKKDIEEKTQIVIIDTIDLESPKEENYIIESRKNISCLLNGKDAPEVSVLIIAYNRLDKTKNCVESILKYTIGIDYELILVDNGSSDGTFEYFESVEYGNKKIIKITKNLQTTFGLLKGHDYCRGRYIAFLNNDMIVTKNWLLNLLKCIKSDESIGIACAMSSNVSNFQDANIKYNSIDEMQQKAEEYNVSDPKKWHERLRLMSLGILYKLECINISGNWDYGFYHDFADDDFSFHIRRAGYKTMLCKDTFVCHDHAIGTQKKPGEFEKSLKIGRENFKKKYYGIDAWDDVNNFEISMIRMVEQPENKEDINILGIDVLCGTPILELKNKLREFDIFDAKLSAFTEKAKYYVDLSTVCQTQVECDRVEYISEYFEKNQFNYILLGKEINLYSEPLKLLTDLLSLLKKGGQLILKLRNTHDVRSLLKILGSDMDQTNEYPINWAVDDFSRWVSALGCVVASIDAEYYSVDNGSINKLSEIIKYSGFSSDVNNVRNNMLIRNYVFNIRKQDSI